MNEISVCKAWYDCEYVAVEKKTSASALRKELTYKFGSLVIFSHGRAKFDLGSGTEQMLDRFCTSLVRRMICRAGVEMSRRQEAMDMAVECMGLSADGHSGRYDSGYAAEVMTIVVELGRRGKNMPRVKEFARTAYSMLREVEVKLAARFPGFGSLSLAVINELCTSCGAEPVDPNCGDAAERGRKKSAIDWILAAAVGFIMLPILL